MVFSRESSVSLSHGDDGDGYISYDAPQIVSSSEDEDFGNGNMKYMGSSHCTSYSEAADFVQSQSISQDSLPSSEEMWKTADNDFEFYGEFKDLRASLDYSYHCNYRKERQEFQDHLIQRTLRASLIRDKNGYVCTTPNEPWIVFTAGAMGAGKSHTINKLQKLNRFPLSAFVSVDPDEIRRELPEYDLYIKTKPLQAGELTRKEAGYIAELIILAALKKGKNVLVDGSLRDHKWYSSYFSNLREEYSGLRIAILHITASRDLVFKRAKSRAQDTGRVVPHETIELSFEQVPRSVAALRPMSDYHAELINNDEIELNNESWESFVNQWIQTCAFKPKHNPILYSVLDVETKRKIDDSSLTKDCIRKLSISIESNDGDS